MKKIIAFIGASALFVSLGAQADDFATRAQESAESTVKERQVTYSCLNRKTVKVTYGFNKQNLPTFAQAKLRGKNWFMPINLHRSDNVDTVFGDDDNYNIMSDAMTLQNYHRSSINVQDATGEILFKNCTAKSSRKLKG